MVVIFKITTTVLAAKLAFCTITGLNFMDPYVSRLHQNPPIDNPCNPLYWYPRQIPDYCFDKSTIKPKSGKPIPAPIPLPVPVPLPQAFPMPMVPNYPLPFGVPLAPTNPMVPVPGVPFSQFYPYQNRQASMVPGIPGIVSPDGGINILPFSDVYADVIERRKRKKLNKRLERILNEYESRRF